jgi:hypothetical protein
VEVLTRLTVDLALHIDIALNDLAARHHGARTFARAALPLLNLHCLFLSFEALKALNFVSRHSICGQFNRLRRAEASVLDPVEGGK